MLLSLPLAAGDLVSPPTIDGTTSGLVLVVLIFPETLKALSSDLQECLVNSNRDWKSCQKGMHKSNS